MDDLSFNDLDALIDAKLQLVKERVGRISARSDAHYREVVAARLADQSPDDRRIAALAAITVAVDPARRVTAIERVTDVRAVLDALEEAFRPVSS